MIVCVSDWYVHICLQVDEQQLKRQLEEITAINQMREKLNTKFPVSHTHSHNTSWFSFVSCDLWILSIPVYVKVWHVWNVSLFSPDWFGDTCSYWCNSTCSLIQEVTGLYWEQTWSDFRAWVCKQQGTVKEVEGVQPVTRSSSSVSSLYFMLHYSLEYFKPSPY